MTSSKGITDLMDVNLSELRELVMDREAWLAAIQGVTKSRTRLSDWTELLTSWMLALQAPLSMKFSRQEYWSGFPFPPPPDLRNPGIQPRFPALQADFFFTIWTMTEAHIYELLFSCLVVSDSLQSHGLQHFRLPCSSPTPGSSSNSCPLSW